MSDLPVASEGAKIISTARVFVEALSGNPTHNYLNQAYHDAGVHYLCPPPEWHWRIPTFTVPLKVRRLLRAEDVVASLKGKIEKARTMIEEGKFYLNRETERHVYYSDGGPHPELHPAIEVTPHKVEGTALGWDYAFNAYELAVALLGDYEQFIQDTVNSELSQFTKIARIHQEIESERYRESVGLVNTEMTFRDLGSRWGSPE
jgi:hypothetical protein